MAKLIITWHAIMDDRTCPVCRALNGYTWTFETGKDMLTDSLWHPAFGQVWSLSLGSNAHGHHFQRHNCRCHISHSYDLEDVLAKCVYLREFVQSKSEPYITWRGGGFTAEE